MKIDKAGIPAYNNSLIKKKKVTLSMICPNCGKETGGKFCPHCGTRMFAAESTVPETTVFSDARNAFRQTPPAASEAPAAPETPDMPQAPAQGSAANPVYANPKQPSAPNRPAPQLGVSAQGYNPGQPANTGDANRTPVDPGNSPARMAVRRIASSRTYLLSALLFTASLVFSAIFCVKQFVTFFQYYDYYRNNGEALTMLIGMAISLTVVLIMALALWRIFFAAIRKNPIQMRTGGLTTIKVFLAIALVCMILCLIALVALAVFIIVAADKAFLDRANDSLLEFLRQYNYTFEETDSMDFKKLLILLSAVSFAVLLIVTVYIGKLIKTVNTVKRVIRIGYPDDRVSPFAAVMCLLSGIGGIFSGISNMIQGKDMLLTGISFICSAVCIFLFGVLIFRFRGKMRMLGVYHGVSTS